MQRITITLDDELLEAIDQTVLERGYQGRSEAIRDFARIGLQQTSATEEPNKDCVAAVVYIYDHAARDLSRRLVNQYHADHDVTLATLHVHLDDDNCMELAALRGKSDNVRRLGEHIIAERGVKHGRLVVMPSDGLTAASHPHMHAHHQHPKRRPAKKAR